jgi:FKBP-type peptidyl-prolyl cis-trans isomerase 2
VYDHLVQIETGKRVRIRVKLASVDGEPIEENVVEYLQGTGKMLPGLERALAGLEAGARQDGVLPAKEAFGDPLHSPHKALKRADFPPEAALAAGERFAAKGVNGADVVLFIHDINGDDVDVQLLHPLADKDIKYSVEVLNVTDPVPPPMPGEALQLDEG